VKRKKTKWERIPWTPFKSAALPADAMNAVDPPSAVFLNSRYQVVIYYRRESEPFGLTAHLSIKTHDRQPHHDWRDLQRIKNELCGVEYDAVEIYPAESKLVDTANQYHLFVFRNYKLPFGFQTRLVGDGDWMNSKQRPGRPGGVR